MKKPTEPHVIHVAGSIAALERAVALAVQRMQIVWRNILFVWAQTLGRSICARLSQALLDQRLMIRRVGSRVMHDVQQANNRLSF